jgi:hypothetical protein
MASCCGFVAMIIPVYSESDNTGILGVRMGDDEIYGLLHQECFLLIELHDMVGFVDVGCEFIQVRHGLHTLAPDRDRISMFS